MAYMERGLFTKVKKNFDKRNRWMVFIATTSRLSIWMDGIHCNYLQIIVRPTEREGTKFYQEQMQDKKKKIQ